MILMRLNKTRQQKSFLTAMGTTASARFNILSTMVEAALISTNGLSKGQQRSHGGPS
jgi:hypothetical protein